MVYKAVVFDYGGVIMNYKGLESIIKDIADERCIPLDVLKAVLMGKEWNVVDGRSIFCGEITGEEAEEEILRILGEKHGIQLSEPLGVLERWLGPQVKIDINNCMMEAVHMVREANLCCALLTNNFYVDKARQWARTPIDFDLFDVVVESAIEGHMKPNPHIYQLTQDRLPSIDPSEVLFLDDVEENLREPRNMGWTCILVNREDPEGAATQLKALLNI